jgi:hypothetical protein
MSTGQRRGTKVRPSPRRLLAPLVGALAAAGAWAALVVLAVRLGRDATNLSTWAPAVAVTAAAVVCMLVVFSLLSRAWGMVRGVEAARRAPGRRRR